MNNYSFTVDQVTRSISSLTGRTTQWKELRVVLEDLDYQGSIIVAEFSLTKDDLMWLLNDEE